MKILPLGVVSQKTQKFLKFFYRLATLGRHNSAIITYRRKFTTKITLYGISSFTVEINSKPFPWNVHSVQQTSPNFRRRLTRVDNTVDNAYITQSQAANHGQRDTKPRRMQEVNSLCRDSRALRAEYCTVVFHRIQLSRCCCADASPPVAAMTTEASLETTTGVISQTTSSFLNYTGIIAKVAELKILLIHRVIVT